MRTVIESKEVFKFNELSYTAKQKACIEFSCIMDYDHEECKKSLELFLASLGYSLKNYCISDIEPSWARIEADDETMAEISGSRLYGYIYKWYVMNYMESKRYAVHGSIYDHNNKVRRSRITLKEYGCPFTGMWIDEAATSYIKSILFEGKFDATLTLDDFVHNCVDLFVEDWKNDYEWYYSEDNVEEMSDINDWEYLEDGTFYAA